MMSFLSPRKRSEAEIHVEDKAIFDGDFGIVGSDSYLTGWFS